MRASFPGDMLDHDFIDLQQALAGEYSLERELGRGGMGIVYLAREVQLDRLVAIKVLPESLAVIAAIRQRFLGEARMAASLSHPHIVPIYRVSETAGFVFFVMAYVHGETLGERLRSRGPLSIAAGTRLLREVTWALSYAHGRGIVHRDIKPDNILIEAETGRALVTDFGIALSRNQVDEPGRVMGTAHFMSPEQATGHAIDGRSDLYSVGVVGHLALCGRLPVGAAGTQTGGSVGLARTDDNALAVQLPRALSAVIDRCLRPLPEERFESGEQLAEALEGASAPVRAKLPMALRVWTQSVDPLRPAYIAWSGIFTMGFLSQLATFGRPGSDWPVLLGFDLLPLVPITIFHARKTYQALSAGYTLRDLRSALSAWQNERREELAFELDEVESGWAKGLRWITYALVASVGVLLFDGLPRSMALKIATVSLVAGSIATFTVSNALGVRLIAKRIRPKLIGAVRSTIFNSRVGEWVVRLLTPAKRKQIAGAEFRPTEIALGLAVEELFAALPKAYRDHLAELPAVVRLLEAHAEAARARVDEIVALMAVGGEHATATPAPALAANRDAAKSELAKTVVALEAIRLDLLRLHGGASDLRPITTVMRAAKDLGDDLSRLGGAQREVDGIARPSWLHLTPPTPV
ncbi:MAG TPA: serine/threonine-protein kinase [Gemmatimonadaceae bacterium]|jgi:serine/threonine-protein kinase